MNAPRRPNCPDDEVIQELAAGILSPAMAEQTMHHVARCNICGTALRRYIREFSEEQSPDDIAILNQLESSKPQWQKRLVRELIGGGRRFPWLKIAPAALALAAVIFAVIQVPVLLANFKVKKAAVQVATAFTERRTTLMRLPGVEHSDYKSFPIELGSENGRGLDEIPTSLHDATGAANNNLRAANPDLRWLQVQGRALLWESTPSSLEKAEKDFEKARSSGLATPSLEIDLAASYFERDSRAEHPNLKRTLDLLSEVLSKPDLSNDDQASALFNLAIAYEKTQVWDLAVDTWEKYLKVDPSSGWAAEARQHLKDARARISGTGHGSRTDPGDFLQLVQSQGTNTPVEQFQDVALTSWLPNALKHSSDTDSKALQVLADLLLQQHSDRWLVDMLASLKPIDVPAVEALAAAVKKNGNGDHKDAKTQAQIAARLFAQRQLLSAELRARMEEVNSVRRSLDGTDCLARADPLWNRLSATQYHWLQSRLSLEKAECSNLIGDFSQSDNYLRISRSIARKYDFPLLELRDIGISASIKHLRGDCSQAWHEAIEGLIVYWRQPDSLRERYQFYSVMLQCALETGSLYAGEAFLRKAIQIRENDAEMRSNRNINATLHIHLANVLLARKAATEAAHERKKAEEILQNETLPPQFDLTVKLEPAEFQLEHGDAGLALTTLEPLRESKTPNPDKFFSLRLNQALGNTYLKLKQFDNANAAYQKAITASESALEGIKNPTERLLWLRAIDESYRGQVRVSLDEGKFAEALERWELYRSRPLLQNISPAGQTSQDLEPQLTTEQVKHGSGVRLIYASFNDGLEIWLLRDGQVTSHWVHIGKQELEHTVQVFAEKCATETSDLAELHELGARLYSWLVDPVSSKLLASETISIELDQSIHNLPLEALRTPDSHYLAEKYALVYSPGTQMEKMLRPALQLSGQESLLLLDASHNRGAGYLPGFDMQRNAIERLFRRAQVIDSSSTSWSQVRPLVASNLIFHYMGHGRPDGSGISLDYDSHRSLRAGDFSPEVLRHSRMIVLAACSSAAGTEYGLEDTHNLVHAFFSAGVPSVIASHWNVDAAATSQLVIGFYTHLARRESIAQAMYNARIAILKTNAHPYYWAGFSLSGKAS